MRPFNQMTYDQHLDNHEPRPDLPRLANLRVGLLREIGNGVIFGSMITHMKLVKMGQKSQAFLTQMVQFGGAIA